MRRGLHTESPALAAGWEPTGPLGGMMQRFFREFLADPDQDVASFLARVQAFYDALP
jgi:hypothetical protein